MSDPLSAENVEIAYAAGADPAIRGLDLSVRQGELLAVVGPNGSGKSTLVRALSRVLRPAQGIVLLDGRDLYSSFTSREAAFSIGVVSQTTTVAFDFTVRDVVEMGRMPFLPSHPFAGLRRDDHEIVDRSLATMGVGHLVKRLVTSLSGGEQQRVMIARALAQEPGVLLLDEPTAHLDIQHQLAVLSLLRRLAHREGKAVLVVLHDLNLAAAYADRMVLLMDGVVLKDGLPADVLSAGNIEAAYGTRVWLRNDPASGRPYIAPLPEVDTDLSEATGLRIHLIAGGGTGVASLMLLRQMGCDVTMGVLNVGDTDQEAADALGARYISEKPFTAVSPASSAAAAALAADAALVILADVPFGHGNLPNLEQAVSLREMGKPVIALSVSDDFTVRDFTDGHATRLWQRLLDLGVEQLNSPADIPAKTLAHRERAGQSSPEDKGRDEGSFSF